MLLPDPNKFIQHGKNYESPQVPNSKPTNPVKLAPFYRLRLPSYQQSARDYYQISKKTEMNCRSMMLQGKNSSLAFIFCGESKFGFGLFCCSTLNANITAFS